MATKSAPHANDEHVGDSEPESNVRIVAIGASAGGLEPFERFFDAMPDNSGLAFVVIQHLSPNFKSMMDELLARHSDMPIHRIDADTPIQPNAIYLNQPRLVPTISNGRFTTTDTSASGDPNLPINTFFESLAREHKDDAIGVILSGTGSDGTKGCEAIKNAGGAVFVQEPTSAKFDGMPNSVINRRIADAIAGPELLPGLILEHVLGKDVEIAGVKPASPSETIFSILANRFGTDFRCYKANTIERRIKRRYEMCGLDNLDDYAELLSNDKDEVVALYNDLLIDVTAFFRDPEAFDALDEHVLDALVSRMSEDYQLRIWVAGCASGEEPYSLAMLIADYAREKEIPLNLKILATDIHHRSLDAASAGVYPEQSMKGISSERVGRYFEKQGAYYHINPRIRRLVVFTRHSLFKDPPFTRMDLVSCRNMLIYFTEPAQQKAISLFHFSLNKDGFLFLGPSETVGKLSGEFDIVDQRWRIFKKTRNIRLVESTTVLRSEKDKNVPLPLTNLPRGATRESFATGRPETRRAFNDALASLLTKYAPPGFLVTLQGEIVHTFGDAGKFLSVSEGSFSNRVSDLVHDDLKLTVSAGLERMRTHVAVPFERRAAMTTKDGAVIGVHVALEGLPDTSGTIDFLLMTIEEDMLPTEKDYTGGASYIVDGEATQVLQGRIKELERDLRSTEESLQTTIEELETSNEELQATNEELMASNEELQSTNEELHSVNEELYTVSAEHQRKIEELTELTADMDQLLISTEIGTVFLDADLRLRRFTPAATKTFNLMAQDISRPFSHITHQFDAKALDDLLTSAVETGEPVERQLDADDHAYLVRILPFMPIEYEPAEYVITAVDIDAQTKANARITENADFYKTVLQDIGEFIVRWRADTWEITYCNAPYARLYGKSPDDLIGANLKTVAPLSHAAEMKNRLAGLDAGDAVAFSETTKIKDGKTVEREGDIRAVGSKDGKIVEFQSTTRDATEARRYQKALESLIEISQDPRLNFSNAIHKYLDIGRAYFDLPHSMIKREVDGAIHLETYSGSAPSKFKEGRINDRDRNLCSIVIDTQQPLFEHDLAASRYADHSAHTKQGCSAYVGAPITVSGQFYGSVCFFNQKSPLAQPFATAQISFALLLARWIGFQIEKQRQIEAVQTSEQDLRRIFDNVPTRIWYKDDKNTILRLNETAAASMGVSVEDATGASTYDLFPEVAKKYHQDDLAVFNSGKPILQMIEEYAPKGQPKGWVLTDKIPFVEQHSDERKLLVVSSDVTKLKQQEQELSDLNAELLAANDGLRQFAYVASHDLQEPLRKILQFGELLEDAYRDKLDEEGEYFLSVISSAAERMHELIRDLLQYSRTSQGEIETRPLCLADIITEVRETLSETITEKNATFNIGKLPTIEGDPTMVTQLFQNLIINGIKYSKPDEPPVISIRAKSAKGHIKITVTDNGTGMEEEYLDKIFEPFKRLVNEAEISGSGIGLAICKSVCERHGWDLSVSSEFGAGSTFTISIPKASLSKA